MNTFSRNRVVMATIGSLGDLHPYIALALEMRKRYIEPVIATSEIYRQRIESLNIEFYPIRPAMPEPETPEYFKMIDSVVDPNRGAEYLFKRILAPIVFTLGSSAIHVAGDFYRVRVSTCGNWNRVRESAFLSRYV